jgi:glycosyltransferase involved in cell wall biosynthesis
MTGPLVSVIIPTCGREALIGDAIESALSQSHWDVEVIVVDDGATDATAQRALRYPGVRVLQQGQRTGISVARNRALGDARGEYVAFLDDDDRLRPTALEVGLRELAAHAEAAMAFGRARLMSASWEEKGVSPPRVATRYADVLRGNYPPHPAAAIVRREAALSIGGFDVWRGIAQDYEFYLRLARRFPIRAHDEVVSDYRTHDGNVRKTKGALACLTALLTILDLQRPKLSGPDEQRAWLEARDHWRRIFGDALFWEVVTHARRRDVLQAVTTLGATLRHAPPESFVRFASDAFASLRRKAA